MNDNKAALYVVATPIGNLSDITFRAIDTLKKSDLILCEKISTSRKLFNTYDIKTAFLSYAAGNEKKILKNLSEKFEQGKQLSLISEAGTPAISDPGYQIINFCYENGYPVIPIPGPCAATALLSVSGFSSKNSLFYGFLPNKKGKRENILRFLINNEKKPIILYESPYRFKNLLEILCKIDLDMSVIIGREMTKKFEEINRDTVKNIYNLYDNRIIKGEFTIIINNVN